MKLIYRIGGNNQNSLGVVEVEFEGDECKDYKDVSDTINVIKKLYYEHRVLANQDPVNILKEIKKP